VQGDIDETIPLYPLLTQGIIKREAETSEGTTIYSGVQFGARKCPIRWPELTDIEIAFNGVLIVKNKGVRQRIDIDQSAANK
jgi:hypothetical protein